MSPLPLPLPFGLANLLLTRALICPLIASACCLSARICLSNSGSSSSSWRSCWSQSSSLHCAGSEYRLHNFLLGFFLVRRYT